MGPRAWWRLGLVSRKPGVPAGLSGLHGPLLLRVLIFFSLNTLSGRGGSTQTVKAWMPPLVSWLEVPAGVMGTGLEEGWPTWVSSGVAWAQGHLGEQPPAGLFGGGLWMAWALRGGAGAWGLMLGFH